jgi:hypothetical protein
MIRCMNRPQRRSIFALSIFASLALAMVAGSSGCSEKLDTGYQPRVLGASTETRRGFYAQPFSLEAQRAKQYEQDFGSPGGRAKPGY